MYRYCYFAIREKNAEYWSVNLFSEVEKLPSI